MSGKLHLLIWILSIIVSVFIALVNHEEDCICKLFLIENNVVALIIYSLLISTVIYTGIWFCRKEKV